MPPVILSIANDAIATGLVPGDFAVIQGVNWNSGGYFILQKDGMNWNVGFPNPAPSDGSGRLYYLAAAPPATGTQSLGDYLDEVRRLLHDQGTIEANFQWATADLIKDINKAIRQRDLWSNGSLAYRQNVALTPNQDIYSLATLFSDLTVLDVINIWLIYGSRRYHLDNPTFTTLTTAAAGRGLLLPQGIPYGWTRRGPDVVYIAKKPSQAFPTDWDLSVLSTTLVNLTDVDPLVFPYTEPVPYYAAYLACVNARRWDLADQFMGLFTKAMRDIEGSRVGEMLTYYGKSGARAAR